MTAEVIALPSLRAIAVPALSRDQRQAELVQLCWQVTVDSPPTPLVIRVAVQALAHESLKGLVAEKAWRDYVDAENQFLDCETGESWLWTPDPGQAKADRDDALNYLLDGTTTRVVR